ncbi:MAG: biopolymer transporter ExbD [Gammaproteobacteria bacterium]|nr:biopolymer transporter ExbD [Gammaproteobacteria bacterium]MDE0453826.1 biopolymer transporter ExbD [Gammaproteobacteria bacterium]MDE0679640.1 biopolymer transporter ExbD [Gammaproteobacteria bacterium]
MIERKHRKRSQEEAEINITPMLDIVFIMLIFFIVTTSFVKELGVDLDRPSNAPVQEQKRSEVIPVRIDANGQVFVEDRLVHVGAIRANIVSGLAGKPDATVVVIADRNADSGFIVTVVDQARVAGAAKVSLAAASN